MLLSQMVLPWTLSLVLIFSARIVTAADDSWQMLLHQAQQAEASNRLSDALELLNQAAQKQPQAAEIYSARGGVHFKLAQISQSLADFEKQIQLRPQDGPAHWRRGLTLYYAGKYAEGVRQFTTSDRAEPEDVENAVWHLLCNAQVVGLEKARQNLLPIKADRRVPFMEIYALFAGRTTPEQVLSRARAGNPEAAELRQRLFYTYLYWGLYEELLNHPRESLDLVQRGVREYPIRHYMMDVAKVHVQLRQARK